VEIFSRLKEKNNNPDAIFWPGQCKFEETNGVLTVRTTMSFLDKNYIVNLPFKNHFFETVAEIYKNNGLIYNEVIFSTQFSPEDAAHIESVNKQNNIISLFIKNIKLTRIKLEAITPSNSIPELSNEECPLWWKVKNDLFNKLGPLHFFLFIDPIISNKDNSLTLRYPTEDFFAALTKDIKQDIYNSFAYVSQQVGRQFKNDNLSFELYNQSEKDYWLVKHGLLDPKLTVSFFDQLTPNEAFDRLFDVYPVKKNRDNCLKVFLNLHKSNQLPKFSIIYNSIISHSKEDYWWYSHTPPLFDMFLINKKWKDEPYSSKNLDNVGQKLI
jgi:hypothetical protein